MSGTWVLVCGPSGSGKDSVIDAARWQLTDCADIVFARRMVTRPVQPGSDHDAVDEEAFTRMLDSGDLRWHWQAHGFYYGISCSYDRDVVRGKVVVVNGSRAHVKSLERSAEALEAQVRVVEITAPPAQLANRLARRGRDSDDAIQSRLERNSEFTGLHSDLLVVNDGELQAAGRKLADYLNTLVVKR